MKKKKCRRPGDDGPHGSCLFCGDMHKNEKVVLNEYIIKNDKLPVDYHPHIFIMTAKEAVEKNKAKLAKGKYVIYNESDF